MGNFVVTIGEDKRITAAFQDMSGAPVDPSPAPTITILHPDDSVTGPNNMVDDVAAVGSWLYDWDTAAIVEGKHRFTLNAKVGTFDKVDKFYGFAFPNDIVDDIINDMRFIPEIFEFTNQEDLRYFIGGYAYLAWRGLKEIPGFTFDWNQNTHYDVVMCRAEIMALEALKRTVVMTAADSEFTIGQLTIRSSPGRSVINQVDDIIGDVRSDCRRRSAELFGNPVQYKRWVVVKFKRELTEAATAAGFPSEAWWRLYGGNAP